MTYSQGGKIDASDYNGLVGSSPSSTSNRINTVWSAGSGAWGYGQTALSQVSQSATVTATQWTSLINTLNSILTHQAGAGSGISTVTSGSKINYLSTLQTNVNTAYTNARNFNTNAAVVVGTAANTTWSGAATSATVTRSFGLRAAFQDADHARYFFNSGGRLKYNLSGARNGSTTGRTDAIVALCTDMGGIALFASNTNGGRTGTGGTVTTNDTTRGYYTSSFNANTAVVAVTSTTTSYTTDTANIAVKPQGTQGTNNDNGLSVDFWTTINSTSGASGANITTDDWNALITQSIDVSYPETTNLSNTWGAVTVSSL